MKGGKNTIHLFPVAYSSDKFGNMLKPLNLNLYNGFLDWRKLMNLNWKKASSAAIIAMAFAGATLAPTQQAQAGGKELGAAILGGIVGGIVGGAINRCHSHGGYNHCHNHNGGHNHYQSGVVYVQPQVIQPQPVIVAPAGYPAQHYQWCYNKYRSYHQPSNTYQPLPDIYGNYPPRRLCRSPWG